MKRNFIIILVIFLFSAISNAQSISSQDKFLLTSEDYITGEDGIVRFSINIWGHVPKPGTYLAYEGIDLLTALSFAGGLKEGADYGKVIINSGGNKKVVNIRPVSNTSKNISSEVILKPKDTIIVNQTRRFRFSQQQSRVATVILQMLNLLYTIDKLD